MESEDGRLLAAMLGSRARKDTPYLADQSTLQPESAGGVKKLAHLATHATIPCRGTEDDAVRGRQIVDRGDLDMLHALLGLQGAYRSQNFRRECLGDTHQDRLAAGDVVDPLSDRFRHPMNMTAQTVDSTRTLFMTTSFTFLVSRASHNRH